MSANQSPPACPGGGRRSVRLTSLLANSLAERRARRPMRSAASGAPAVHQAEGVGRAGTTAGAGRSLDSDGRARRPIGTRGVRERTNGMRGGGPRSATRPGVGAGGCQSGRRRGQGGGRAAGPLFVVIPRWSSCWGTPSAPRWGRAWVGRPGGEKGGK